MWIGKDVFRTMNGLIESSQNRNTEMLVREGTLRERISQLEKQVQQQLEREQWFRHRLTQVEQERAQLIYAATGGKGAVPEQVKIAAPNFDGRTPVDNFAQMAEMLNKGFNPFQGVGEDSQEAGEQIPEGVEDTSNMPRSR